MEIRIKNGGKIIDLSTFKRVIITIEDPILTKYEGVCVLTPDKYEFLNEKSSFDNIGDKFSKVNWERRRYELVREMISGCIADPNVRLPLDERLISDVIFSADSVIKQLKDTAR